MNLMARSRVGALLFLTRATTHPYIIRELESSPNVLRAVGPHLHWELLTRRSTAGRASVNGTKGTKSYHTFLLFFFFCLLSAFIYNQPDSWLGSLCCCTKQSWPKGKEGEHGWREAHGAAPCSCSWAEVSLSKSLATQSPFPAWKPKELD